MSVVIEIIVNFLCWIRKIVFEKGLSGFTKKFYSYTNNGSISVSLEKLIVSGYSEKEVRKFISIMFKRGYLINASSHDGEAWILNLSGLGYYRSL